jgi:hypothetical protein
MVAANKRQWFSGGGRRRECSTAAGGLSGVCGLQIFLHLFLLQHRERGFERTNKVEVINNAKTTTMYIGGGGDMTSAIAWRLLQCRQITSGS